MSTIAPPAFRTAAAARPSPDVGKWVTRAMTSGERGASVIWGAAEGAFAYVLYKGLPPFSTPHPIWGTLFAIGAVGNLAWAVAGTTGTDDGSP